MEAKKLITATDTQYSGSLLQALNDQRMQGLFCDVTVIVEDRKFRAHKNILSACSTYFHQLFSVAGQVVELNFVKADIFAEILNYIYSAKIVRVKCEMLEELIKSGKLLGVPFIADLGIPLSQVKSISGGIKDGSTDSQSSSVSKEHELQKETVSSSDTTPENKSAKDKEMPVITEAFSLSCEEFNEKKKVPDSKDEDSDDDVIFCSEIVTAKPPPSDKKEVPSQTPPPNDQSLDLKKSTSTSHVQLVQNTKSSNQLVLKMTSSPQKLNVTVNTNASTQVTNGSVVPSSAAINTSSDVTSSLQKNLPISANVDAPKLLQTANILPKTELVEGNCISAPVPSITLQKNISFDGSGVQKKQVVTFSQESSSKPGEFKIKIADVGSGSNKESHREPESKRIMDGKKIITLDTTSEIESLSTGCKVYANIGEDTYDIVIPIKEDPDEGFSKFDEEDFPNRKRMKVKHDDHYELIVDGRVYYICIVCKRSYVCLTSLRRHFNVHSWEKKYPCRYCERVFPLAEYRTKHEIHHTGERRYQCLTCGNSFINYQVMSSHIRSAHSLDPAGDSKLYRLNPCKTLQIRQYSYITDPSSNAPVINDGGIVYDIDPDKPEPASEEDAPSAAPKPMNWDDVFLQQSNQNIFKPNASDGSTEFEFVIPESY
ncbi:transcriptional regulator Kaiso isoform X1 [Pelobates fuscus]|uniref:transcriptional regulator Kaiso isoform X1 n=1 Tax=Pelobates fuscus TaxID=191477 RepID=UPI002FE47C55